MKSKEITVLDQEIHINKNDYFSLTDIARYKNSEAPADVVKNWLRRKDTIEFIGLWEKLNNPNFNVVEFDQFKNEAAHGTVTRHYYKHLKGEETSTNSVATLFAWTGALRKRGELDGNKELSDFADKLEKATIKTIEDGVMTGDLYVLSNLDNKRKVNTEDFLLEINNRLKATL